MSRITYIFEDTDIGLVSIEVLVSGKETDSPALRMATDIGHYIDAVANKIGGNSIPLDGAGDPQILLPHSMRN